MTESSWFRPSERALEFGAQYAQVLANWGTLFNAASELVASNVILGRMAVDGANEFEKWFQGTASAPFSWMSPEALTRAMQGFGGTTGKPPKA